MLRIFDSSSDIKTMMERTFAQTQIGVSLVVMGLTFSHYFQDVVSVSFIASVLTLSFGLPMLVINGARCALYTNEYERLRRE